jgi:hypothetical protein
MLYIKQTIIIVTVSLLLINCKKKENVSLSSSVTGYVTLYDTKGNEMSSCNGVTVTLEGTNTSISTDSSGKYIIPNVHVGEYCFIYTKAGYGTWKKFSSFTATGGSSPIFTTKVTLFPICNTITNSLVIKDSIDTWGNNFKIVTGSITPTTDSLNPVCVYFTFGNSSSFSFENSKYNISTTILSGKFRYIIQNFTLADIQRSCGNTLYLISYISNLPNNEFIFNSSMYNSYYDYELGKTIYPFMGQASSALPITIK